VNILLIGPPGSGKGTQGARVANALGLEHIAVGDVLRAEIAAGTPLSDLLQRYLDRGELAPDELVLQLVVPLALAASARRGYVLDGFPRSVAQAREARKLAEPARARPDLVVYLTVPEQVLVERLLARAEVEGRPDDTEEVIRNRLRVFAQATAPLLEYYRDQDLAREVDASASPEEITEAILDVARAGRVMTYWFANPSQLLEQAGKQLGTSDWVLIGQDRIDGFADITGDHQWIHVDVIRAASGPFGTTVAHGYLTLALAPVLLQQVVTVEGVNAVVNYGLNRVRFPAPVPVGSRVRGHVTLVSASRRGDAVEAVFALTVEIDGGSRPACVAELVVLYS
jgi:adenylate kinase